MLGAILGAIAGSEGSKSRSTTNTATAVRLRGISDLNRGRSQTEAVADTGSLDLFQQLQQLLRAGPGEAEVQAGTQAQKDLADRLQSILGQGGLDVAAGQQFAQQIFQPQQVALQQSFADQQTQANRLAARLGRTGNDPILRNKLAQEQTRQQTMLNAQQGAFAAEQAYQLPQNQMNYAQALSNVRSGLATQAFQNRQTLMGLGQSLVQQERQYRLNAAGQVGQTGVSQTIGGGFGGAAAGALAGFGAEAKAAGSILSLMKGG